jgi:hypothetical protein
MSHDHAPSPAHKQPTWLYIAIVVVLVLLAIWGVAAYRGHKADEAAKAKAEQLNQSFAAAGLPTFSDTTEVARVLGTDGGAVCATPGKALAKSLLKIQLSNGAGGIGLRPITVDKQTLQGEYLILKTYCPDKVEKFATLYDGLDYADVVKE